MANRDIDCSVGGEGIEATGREDTIDHQLCGPVPSVLDSRGGSVC